eukprot:2289178-Prymnesium_polylepis.1
MADDVAGGGIGSLRAPCGASVIAFTILVRCHAHHELPTLLHQYHSLDRVLGGCGLEHTINTL